MGDHGVRSRLRRDIERSGYYPALVDDSLTTALGGERVLDFIVHHEATFDRDELRRHATVVALTPTRLILQHTDDHPADETCDTPYATSVVEAVRLSSIGTVVVTRVVKEPERYRPHSAASEAVLSIGWGAVNRIELEPASCGDPECEADHGYTGSSTNDDLSLRFSAAADGGDVVERALEFAKSLSAAAGIQSA
ncbi:MAG: DUF5998 family protein [Candidatus Nanopelagicales bacterium]|nr:DUF5998 family protein [Candidatus Nanopelagicales bacterium]